VPSEGLIIAPQHENNLDDVLKMGCWTPVVRTAINEAATWETQLHQADGSVFSIMFNGAVQGQVQWTLTGEHNVYNALSAIAAAHHVGILPAAACEALSQFQNVKRRMEVIANMNGVTVYDDFAHHPTAIKTTLEGLRKRVQQQQIVAIVEPRSNTMRMGIHTESLANSLATADVAIIYQPAGLNWDLSALKAYNSAIEIYASLDEIIARLTSLAQENSHFVLMSNGGFGGIYQRLQASLAVTNKA
jgi:UDP-N-acetylmuramate: L-alanyl-gamma-D-glutamyl-meso-diaminopimelate ligase